MQTTVLYSKPLQQEVKNQIIADVSNLKKQGKSPKLAIVQVGNDPASNVYVNIKKKTANECGLEFKHILFDEKTTQKELDSGINKLNNDNSVSGIILQLPVPKHLNCRQSIDIISPKKDVDGLTSINAGKLELGLDDAIVPATPLGIMNLLKWQNINLAGLNAVVIGRSHLVGRPMASLLSKANATVTVCHKETKNIKYYLKNADLIVCAAGCPALVKNEHIKKGAILIDVGTTPEICELTGKKSLNGDVCKQVQLENSNASMVTPVPGGVGPMTVISLISNVVNACKGKH